MKTLTIRGVPEEVHRALRERARRNRRSLNQEVIAGLTKTVEPEAPSGASEQDRARKRAEQMAELVEQWRSHIPKFLSAEDIDTATEEGRE